jgi:molybdate transport system substrate-binding protein
MQKVHEFMRVDVNASEHRGTLLQRRVLLRSALVVGAMSAAGVAAAKPIRVAAASDLKFALGELAALYRQQSGQMIEVTLGSSGNFAQQIRQGLPVDLYLAADESYVFQLADAKLTRDRGVIYAHGRIALIVGSSSTASLEGDLGSFREALPAMRHFAIANPEHAPYGRAAQQALQRLGWWDRVKDRLVLGENVAQATQFVTSGAADAGITALSLALAPPVSRHLRSVVLPAELHALLRQRMVLLRSASDHAAAFYRFLQDAPARAVLQRHGFATP